MEKIVRIGSVKVGDSNADIFSKITFKNGRMTINGVIGPTKGGKAIGGCGQISMDFQHRNPEDNDRRYRDLITPEEITFSEGWNKELLFDFLDIWKEWHLNDMQAGCEHQTGPEWKSKPITIYYFRLKKEVDEIIGATKKRAGECIKSGKTFTPTMEETRLANLPRVTTGVSPEPPSKEYEPNGPQYKGDTYNKPSEVKNSNWVKPEEHPEGLLGKPCMVCGYKYGTSWRKKEVPVEIINKLESLPDTDKTPAWI